jgi:UDP-N-acetyl-D-glucosamine dehydrogenase
VNGAGPDLSHVQAVAKALPKQALVILESTVGPGDTESCFRDARWLAFSPEREDPGNGRDLTQIPKVMAGRDQQSWDLASLLYAHVFKTIHQAPNIRTAEFSKLVENTYRAVNCALANEFKDAAGTLGVDVHDAIRLAATKPFGFQAFYPGPGVGGHCVPVDPYYLMHATSARMPLVQQAMRSNHTQPARVAYSIMAKMPATPSRRPRVLVVGMAYKKNIDDVRHSPAVALMDELDGLGADVAWSDPYVDGHGFCGFESWPLVSAHRFDAVVLATDHDNVDYRLLDEHPCVFDTRARLRPRKGVIRV